MKIRSILEDTSPKPSPYQIYSDLTAKEIHLLWKIDNDEEFDPFDEKLPVRTHDTLNALLDKGLVDSTYSTTPLGKKVWQISLKVAPSDRKEASVKADAKRAMNRKEKPETVDDVDVDLGDNDDAPEVEDDAPSLDNGELGGTFVKPKTHKKTVRSLRRDDFDSFDKDDTKHFDDDNEYKWD